jgi:predicted phage terminase large subunit-like protein
VTIDVVAIDGLVRMRELVVKMTKEQIKRFAASLPPDDLALLEQVVGDLAGEHWRADPVRMGHHLDPSHIELFPYATLLGRKFADAAEGRSIRQVWLLPAQYGKSTIASQWGPAWHLDRYPDRRLILVSYGDDLAMRNALAVRDILREYPDVMRAQLRRDQQRQDRFTTTAGGGLLGAGLDSTMTGFPAHGIVIDDPFKNWQSAHSENNRELVWNTYRSTIYMRRTSDLTWIILVMTRWHEDDLAGRFVKHAEAQTGEQWEIVRLPEIAEAPEPDSTNPMLRLDDPLGRRPGELLEPRRFSMTSVLNKQLTLGTYLWAGMAQQRPAPEEGTDIKRAWFGIETTAPTMADEAISTWDTKLKDNEVGDYVVGQLWWRVGGGYWLMDQLRGVWDEPTTKAAIALMQVRHPEAHYHRLESAGNAPEVAAALRAGAGDAFMVSDDVADKIGATEAERVAISALMRRGMSGLDVQKVVGDKRARMRAVTPYIEAGDVHIPEWSTWLPSYLDEMAAFPNGSHDDQVDATSAALARLAQGPTSIDVPEGPRVPSTIPSAAQRVPHSILSPRR